jgi:hypothetical protein
MLDFVRNLSRHEREQRQSNRRPLIIEVIALPLDEQLQPIGGSFVAVTRDISTCGVSLVHTTRVDV